MHGLEPVRCMADQRILLDFIGKRTAIDGFTAGSSYNKVVTLRRSKHVQQVAYNMCAAFIRDPFIYTIANS